MIMSERVVLLMVLHVSCTRHTDKHSASQDTLWWLLVTPVKHPLSEQTAFAALHAPPHELLQSTTGWDCSI
jgi:hypothetical protein